MNFTTSVIDITDTKKVDSFYQDWNNALRLTTFNLKPRKESIQRLISVKCVDNGIMVGWLGGGIYKEETTGRCSQWSFGENKERLVWIDIVVSIKKGVGRKLLQELEKTVKALKFGKRQNIYVLSTFKAAEFYRKCGFTAINTPNNEDDEDYPGVFLGEANGCWFAKPLCKELDNETELYPRKLVVDDYQKMIWIVDQATALKDVGVIRKYENWVDENIVDRSSLEKYLGIWNVKTGDVIDGVFGSLNSRDAWTALVYALL